MEKIRVKLAIRNKQGMELKSYSIEKIIDTQDKEKIKNIKIAACSISSCNDETISRYESAYTLQLFMRKERHTNKNGCIMFEFNPYDDMILNRIARNHDKNKFMDAFKELKDAII